MQKAAAAEAIMWNWIRLGVEFARSNVVFQASDLQSGEESEARG
jgi:hypothetical protein